MHELAGDLDARLVPCVGHTGHARIREPRRLLARQHIGEPGAVCAADQMNRGDAPSGIETLANRGIDEQEVVVEMRNDGDERARFAVRRARCRW